MIVLDGLKAKVDMPTLDDKIAIIILVFMCFLISRWKVPPMTRLVNNYCWLIN